jgi:uncharacterized membrane protein YgdD (TMEM256/DUF423 family)
MAASGNPSMRIFAMLAAVFGALGVLLGAFGAHALRGQLDDAGLQAWHTAVEYQFWHALALLAVSLSSAVEPRWRRASGVAFVIGIILFCGSLYALALGAPRIVGTLTPIGGLALIAGWVLLALGYYRAQKSP